MNVFERDDEIGSRSDDSESLDFFPPATTASAETKYIIVTGGVMSGVGKGVCTASLSHLLQQLGFSVTTMKIDGYLNVDAGTLRPLPRHGETFVLDDGTECDLDLGTYERFLEHHPEPPQLHDLGEDLRPHPGQGAARRVPGTGTSRSFPTSPGRSSTSSAARPRKGLTTWSWWRSAAPSATSRTSTSSRRPRELIRDEGRDNVMYIHVTMVPWSEATGEQKSKPTQHSVKKLLELGVQPDIIVCRSRQGLQNKVREKISLHGQRAHRPRHQQPRYRQRLHPAGAVPGAAVRRDGD